MSLEGDYGDDNIFAKIIRGEAQAVRVYEDPDVLSIMDLFPQSDGHLLVLPKHVRARNLLDVDAVTLTRLIVVVQNLTMAVRRALQPDGVMVAQFNGQAAGQTVYHLHFHVIPRWEGQPLKGHGHGQMADLAELRRHAAKIAAALPT
jgi:histidine triad (HIT) family protein